MRLTVVAEKDDDRIIRESDLLQGFEHQADLAIELTGGIQILGPIRPRHSVIGIVGR